jgi:DNA-binding response OmpR family regulator
LNGKKILLVEDDQDAALAVGVMLRRRGFEVTSAADAITAVAVARREHPDLIILDMGLPAGGGDAVLGRLRAVVGTAETPVIVLTGLDISREHALEAGAQDLLRKPVDATQLIGTVTRVLLSE